MKAKRFGKRLLSWLMVMAMVCSVVHISAPMAVKAEDGVHGITLGIPKWTSSERTNYKFPEVTISMSGGTDKQRVFCISVSDGGSFRANLSDIASSVDISGVLADNTYADNSGVTGIKQLNSTEDLISITVLGDITDAEIKKFIQDLVFYRNTTDITKEQKVSVVSSSFDARTDGATALAIDGKLHFYKYIDWNNEVKQIYVGGETATIAPSSVKDQPMEWTWFKAYELAKKETLNGLKGYLATITSPEEQFYIYNRLGIVQSDKSDGAWIGAARTYASETTDSSEKSSAAAAVVFDAETINELYPNSDGIKTGTAALKWRWMCGPESKKESDRVFYTLNNAYAYAYEGTANGYEYWNRGVRGGESNEPNNNDSNKYGQEFCLQYGFETNGAWNDWGPEHNENGNNIDSEEGIYKAPGGFIVEFSPYDINGNGKENDPGEYNETPVDEDLTIITAQPHIVYAELDTSTFAVGKPITVTSVIGDKELNHQLVNTSIPVYQWEVYNEEKGKWENATGDGSKAKSYTPVSADLGKRLRVHITASTDYESANTDKYAGDIYLDATGSDDQTNKITGTTVVADTAVVASDFSVAGGSGHKEISYVIDRSAPITYKYGTKVTGTYTISDEDKTKLDNAIDANTSATVTITIKDTANNLTTDITVKIIPSDKIALESATLSPFKDDHGDEPGVSPEHYYVGEVIKVDEIMLNDGTKLSAADMANNVTYEWQYSDGTKDSSGKQTWTTITGATGSSLTAEQTAATAIAGSKVRVIITPIDGKGYVKTTELSVDGDGYDKWLDENGKRRTDKNGAGGTFVDYLTVQASDIVMSLAEANSVKPTADRSAIANKADVQTNWDNKLHTGSAANDTVKLADETDLTALRDVTGPTVVPIKYIGTATINDGDDNVNVNVTAVDPITTTQKYTTANAYVKDSAKQDTDADGKVIAIGANNITVTRSVAKTFEKADSNPAHAAILASGDYADVVAVDAGSKVGTLTFLGSNPTVRITYDATKPLKAEEGVYPVTYSYTNAAGKRVETIATVTVLPYPNVEAHDIIVRVEDAPNISEDDIKDKSDASGKDESNNPITSDKIDVKDDDVTTIKNTKTPDKISVELENTAVTSGITTTITAHIVDDVATGTDENDPTKKITIGANNFDISVDDVKKALAGDEEILKKLSSVVAVAGDSNVETKDIDVDDEYKTELKAEPGIYPVTFTYNGVSVKVYATVKGSSGSKDSEKPGDNNVDKDDAEEITGNDFTVAGGSTPLTPQDIIDKGNVDAVDGNGTPIVLPPDSSVNKDDLDKLNEAIKDGKKGTYPVEVTTPNGTKVTVNVTVTDKNEDTEADNSTKTDETIAANNFKIGINDYDRIFGDSSKDTNVTKLSNAKAYDTVLKTPIEITSIDTSQVANAAGTYPITLTTAKGTSTTINVTIDGDWDTIGDIDKASQANAQDETVNNDSAKKITPVGISVSPADIVYEKTNPQDKTEPIDSSKQVPPTGALKVDGVNVDQYSVSADGGTLIISKDYLDTLPKGSDQAVVT